MVRVDFFLPSGKWKYTESLRFDRYHTHVDGQSVELIHDTFKRCLREQFPNNYHGMTVVCLEPYHEHAHPLMVTHV